MQALLLITVLLGQPQTPAPHRWTATNIAVASSAALGLLVDWAQTRQALHEGLAETNPVLGPHPSTARLTAYNLLALPAITGIGAALPSRWRTLWYAAVTLVETASITRNASLGLHIGL
ncbi:MAG TPA: hypothetical protein VN848_04770 [Gemmatimonadales bacterium]|nr:hypothetical protein [Gemmatimonadales bacterium]